MWPVGGRQEQNFCKMGHYVEINREEGHSRITATNNRFQIPFNGKKPACLKALRADRASPGHMSDKSVKWLVTRKHWGLIARDAFIYA